MRNNIKITLIVPCYNEETNLQKGVLDTVGIYTQSNPRFEKILIIDDGSSDRSRAIIKEKYLKKFPKFELVENNHQGKAFAIIAGIHNTKTSYVMFCDMDLATPLEESIKLINEAENGYQIVIGSRSTHREGAPLIRKIQSLGFILVRNTLIGLKGIRDTQCGFKLFETKAAEDVLKKMQIFKIAHKISGSSVSAAFDLEFLFLATKKQYRIKEVPVIWHHVETKNVTFFKDAIETMRDIIRIKTLDIMRKYE